MTEPVSKACNFCGATFTPPSYRVKRGGGIFCSKLCSNSSRFAPFEDRFWGSIGRKTNTGCILWNGSINHAGYGTIGRDGKLLLAHRVAYEFMVGNPDTLFVLHECDNPPCVNPMHLFLGTHFDNMEDKVMKGRNARLKGTSNGYAKLNDSIIRDIRRRYAHGETLEAIGSTIGIGKSHVSQIVNREIWSHIQ